MRGLFRGRIDEWQRRKASWLPLRRKLPAQHREHDRHGGTPTRLETEEVVSTDEGNSKFKLITTPTHYYAPQPHKVPRPRAALSCPPRPGDSAGFFDKVH